MIAARVVSPGQLPLAGFTLTDALPIFNDNPREIRIVRALAAGPKTR